MVKTRKEPGEVPWEQSPPPFSRVLPVCYEGICRSREFHRPANSVLTVCLSPGGHRKLPARCSSSVEKTRPAVLTEYLRTTAMAAAVKSKDRYCHGTYPAQSSS